MPSSAHEIHETCLIIHHCFQLTVSLRDKSHSMLVGKSGGSKLQLPGLTECQTHVTGVGAVTSTASTNTATSTSRSPPTVTAADRMTAAPAQRAPNAPRATLRSTRCWYRQDLQRRTEDWGWSTWAAVDGGSALSPTMSSSRGGGQTADDFRREHRRTGAYLQGFAGVLPSQRHGSDKLGRHRHVSRMYVPIVTHVRSYRVGP